MKNNKKKTEIIYGINTIFEALNANRRIIYKVFLVNTKKKKVLEILSILKSRKIEYVFVNLKEISLIAGDKDHQGVIAIVSKLLMSGFSDLLKKDFSDGLYILIMLDNITDPHNFGAIIRTSYCVGTLGIIISKYKSCFPVPSVSKVSAGAAEYVPIYCVNNLVSTIKMLKMKGFWILGLESSKQYSRNIFDVDLKSSIVFVVGSESKGLRPLVKKKCDFLVSVPMNGCLNSLNVSVATAVVLYEALRQNR